MPKGPADATTNRPDIAIIHLTFEGIQTFGGGVSTVTRGHLRALPRVQAALGNHGVDVTPYFCEIAYRHDHPRYDAAHRDEAVRLIKEMGGQFHALVNVTEGLVPRAVWGVGDIGTMDNWKIASGSGAGAALNFAERHRDALIYCHDIVFALASVYATLQEAAFACPAVAVYVVHSTALTHELPLPNPDRLMVESAAIHWAKVMPACKVGFISKFIADHLRSDYGARAGDLVPTGNGINPQDSYFRLRDPADIAAKLRQYRVPLDKPLAFSWGRPVEYKRFDVALKAVAKLGGRVHPVIMLSEDSPSLRSLADQLAIPVSFIAAFDPDLVASMLQWRHTIAALSLAYNEPFGLTPVEVRMLARSDGPLMVVSNTGGLAEQVRDAVDGFVTKQDDPDDGAQTLERILQLSKAERDRVRQTGLETVLGNYTWSSQILKTLAAVYPKWRHSFELARDQLTADDLASLGLRRKSA